MMSCPASTPMRPWRADREATTSRRYCDTASGLRPPPIHSTPRPCPKQCVSICVNTVACLSLPVTFPRRILMASLIAQRQRLGPGSTSFDKSPLASEQRRCDEILRGYGERERAPDRGLGEQLNEYRIRLASLIQRHSPSFDG